MTTTSSGSGLLLSKLAQWIRRVTPAHWRPIRYLEKLVRSRTGARVAAGPFAGMRYIESSFFSAYIPKLLGTYERELAPYIEEACAKNPDLIVDIGAAEGFYAVGLAVRNPQARVEAFEADARGRDLLARMIELNGVGDRVHVKGFCSPNDLESVLNNASRALVVCDVEGGEQDILDLAATPALARAMMLIEVHEFIRPGVGALLEERFSSTHLLQRVWQTERSRAEFPYQTWYTRLLPLSYLEWAVNEWRPERMSWLYMEPMLQADRGGPA